MPPATAVTVWVPAPVELNDPVASPFTSVVAGWVIVLPLPLTASVTATPFIGLPLPSRTVTPTVELPPAANAIGDASTEDNDAEMGDAAGFTVTAACWVIATPLMVADTSLISATVERRLPVISPSPPVVPEGWVRVLPLPVEARTTVAPLIGVPLPSRAVTVIVEAGAPGRDRRDRAHGRQGCGHRRPAARARHELDGQEAGVRGLAQGGRDGIAVHAPCRLE